MGNNQELMPALLEEEFRHVEAVLVHLQTCIPACSLLCCLHMQATCLPISQNRQQSILQVPTSQNILPDAYVEYTVHVLYEYIVMIVDPKRLRLLLVLLAVNFKSRCQIFCILLLEIFTLQVLGRQLQQLQAFVKRYQICTL